MELIFKISLPFQTLVYISNNFQKFLTPNQFKQFKQQRCTYETFFPPFSFNIFFGGKYYCAAVG
jgi:hypothetical protein